MKTAPISVKPAARQGGEVEGQRGERVDAQVLPVSRERARLSVTALGDDTTLAGAAELAFADLLDNPLNALATRR